MNMQQVRAIARAREVKQGNLTKAELIRAIQRDEGNFDCFGQTRQNCEQLSCLWREDCVVEKK